MLAPAKTNEYERLAKRCDEMSALVEDPDVKARCAFLARQWRYHLADQEKRERASRELHAFAEDPVLEYPPVFGMSPIQFLSKNLEPDGGCWCLSQKSGS